MSQPPFQTPPAVRAAMVAAALMARPCSQRDLTAAVGVPLNHPERVMRFANEFHDLGCVYIKSWVHTPFANRRLPVFAWQPSLFALPDAVCPDYFARTK